MYSFSIAHKLVEGDVLVFQLIEHWKFKVYIVRVHGLNEIDGALGLLNLIPSGMNVTNVSYDQSVDDGECADAAPVSEGLAFSESVIEFKDINGVDDFSVVVDNLVIDSEIPKHFLIKYYDLCLSQMTYLHENLLKGMKVGFLRARISKLKGLLFELNELWEAKRKEQAKAEEEMKIIKEKLNDMRGVIKNLDVEIETLKQKKGQKLDTIFHKEANAPW
nr:hypothetical protein [Tanacetum cinerariifolium]